MISISLFFSEREGDYLFLKRKKLTAVTFLGELADWFIKVEISKARNQQLLPDGDIF